MPTHFQRRGRALELPGECRQSGQGEGLLLRPACAVRGQARRHLRQGSFLRGTPCSSCVVEPFWFLPPSSTTYYLLQLSRNYPCGFANDIWLPNATGSCQSLIKEFTSLPCTLPSLWVDCELSEDREQVLFICKC